MSVDDHGTTGELDLDDAREKLGDFLTPLDEVVEIADALVAEVRRLRAGRNRVAEHRDYWSATLHQTPDGWTEATCTAYRMAMDYSVELLDEP